MNSKIFRASIVLAVIWALNAAWLGYEEGIVEGLQLLLGVPIILSLAAAVVWILSAKGSA